jgi:thiol-disulfide isomerase/thioredoxin
MLRIFTTSAATSMTSALKAFSLMLVFGAAVSCAGPATEQADAAMTAPVSMQCMDLDGKTLNPDADLSAGKPVVLVFWQSWCNSCLEEAPLVEQARRKYGDQVAFYGVVSGPDQSVDEDAVRKVVGQKQLKYPTLRDRDGALSRHFDVQYTPSVVILNPDRKVVYSGGHLPESWDWLLND